MQCLACYRNKYGIVTHCRIEHNGEIRDLDKDKVKQMLKSGTKISGLALTSDNRLIQTENKIALYEQSCDELGIVPLTIIKKDNRYIVADIPNGIRNIVIPKFIDSIHVARVHKQKEEPINEQVTFKQYNNIEKGLKSVYKQQLETKDSLDKIDNKLNHLLDRNVQVSLDGLATKKDIENYIKASIHSLNKLEQEIQNCTDEQKQSFNEFKQYINENGQKLLEINKAVDSKLKSIDDYVEQQLKEKADVLDAVKYHKNNAWYIPNEKDDIMVDQSKYEEFMREHYDYGFLDNSKINILTNMICGYYQIMVCMQEQIKQIVTEGEAEYKRTDLASKLENIRDKASLVYKHDGIGGIFAVACDKVIKTTGEAVNLVMPKLIELSESDDNSDITIDDRDKHLKYPTALNKLSLTNKNTKHYLDTVEKLGEPYSLNALLKRYCSNSYDPDIAEYLIESIYNIKSKRGADESQYIEINKNTKGIGNNIYYGIQKLFADNANKKVGQTSIVFDTEMRSRIALSFICAIKIVRGKLASGTGYTEMPDRVNIIPDREVYDVIDGKAVINKYEYPSVNNDNLRKLYVPVLLEIKFTCLLIQKIKPNIARDYIIDPLYKIYSGCTGRADGMYEINKTDMSSGIINIKDYIGKKYKIYK